MNDLNTAVRRRPAGLPVVSRDESSCSNGGPR
jgi:hypothetical protein